MPNTYSEANLKNQLSIRKTGFEENLSLLNTYFESTVMKESLYQTSVKKILLKRNYCNQTHILNWLLRKKLPLLNSFSEVVVKEEVVLCNINFKIYVPNGQTTISKINAPDDYKR